MKLEDLDKPKQQIVLLLKRTEKPTHFSVIAKELNLSSAEVLGHLAYLRENFLVKELEGKRFILTEEGTKLIRPLISKEEAKKILSEVPPGKEFHFYIEEGKYSGISVSCLADFIQAIGILDLKSIEFHIYRGDFQSWIKQVLNDDYLASKLEEIKDSKAMGEDLRKKVHEACLSRYEELRRMLK